MIEDKVLIGGINSNFKIKGEGIPLLILHGWGGSSGSWKNVMENLAKKGFRIISLDFPGFGSSDLPPKPWTLDDYKNWVLEFIKYQKLDKFCLLGHSFGGRVAVKFAAEQPEKIQKLILVDAAGIKMKPSFKTVIIKFMAEAGKAIFGRKYTIVFRDWFRNLFYFLLKNRDYVKAQGVMKETMKKILEEDILPLLPEIKNETLIVWGKDDELVPVKVSYIFKNNIKNSKLEIMSGIGHSPHLENPDKLSEIISDFIL